MLPPIYSLREGISGQFTTYDPATRNKVISMGPGERKVFVDSDKTGIVTRMWFTFPGWFWQHWDPECNVDTTILRKLILRVFWDGNKFPSVEVPMGDFFGIGHCEYRHYVSKYLGMSSGGFYSYFPMPFCKGIRIEIENLHDTVTTLVFMNINYQELEAVPDDWGRFHCMYNSAYNPGTEPVTVLKAEGRGHYVGCCLSMQGKNTNYISYLEAPEYIYIDKEDRDKPSIVGTGLEDYFNGGWYFRDNEFCAPLHGVPLKDVFRSMVSMYRFHENDAINFYKSLEVSFINPWEAERLKPFKFTSTAYWYQDKPSKLLIELPDSDKLVDLYRIRDVDHLSIP